MKKYPVKERKRKKQTTLYLGEEVTRPRSRDFLQKGIPANRREEEKDKVILSTYQAHADVSHDFTTEAAVLGMLLNSHVTSTRVPQISR